MGVRHAHLPGEGLYICKGILSSTFTSEVVTIGKPDLQNTVQPLGLVGITYIIRPLKMHINYEGTCTYEFSRRVLQVQGD